jgi:2-polyprenyl-6-methoxyphenol hydroxylase-like FAD-dependent oxidoreductase
MLPVGLKWDSVPGLTLLGDAAHLMTPNGEGVNTVMHDALVLADAIRKGIEGDLAAAVKEYEVDMFERARKSAERTWKHMETRYGPGGAEAMLKLFTGFRAADEAAVAAAKK